MSTARALETPGRSAADGSGAAGGGAGYGGGREDSGSDLWRDFLEVPAATPQVLLCPGGGGPGVADGGGDPSVEPPLDQSGAGSGRILWARGPDALWRLLEDEVAGAFSGLDRFAAAHPQARLFGWLGYGLRDAVEPIARRDMPSPGAPAAWLGAFHRWRVANAGGPVPDPGPLAAAEELRFALSGPAYRARVAAVVEHIRAGDIFQANLTQPFTGIWRGDPRRLFLRLCRLSPAPFGAFAWDGEGTAVLSSSMEEFLWRDGAEVRTQPIKGTRGRHPDPDRDRAVLQELRAASKDQAELAMIVDLMRNDIGRVAEPGSVRVAPGFPQSASYAQVHHLHHTITAHLKSGTSHGDLLRATWPPGSCTGAPKLRCMEILEQLEVARRGVYTGSVGWLGPGEAMHLNVAIRTLTLRARADGAWDVWGNVGGGITADSSPDAEWQEIVTKAKGMGLALGAAPGGPD